MTPVTILATIAAALIARRVVTALRASSPEPIETRRRRSKAAGAIARALSSNGG